MVHFKLGNDEKIMPRILLNIGARLDIPTCSLLIGRKGETIINGGLGPLFGVVGPGNSFKSTIIQYCMLSAASRIFEAVKTTLLTYDTENNTSISRLEHLASKFPYLPEEVITGAEACWTITDKSAMYADKFANLLNEYFKEKIKDKNSKVVYQAFTNPYTKEPLEGIIPTFTGIDSFTEAEDESTGDLLEKNLGDSSTTTYAIKQGGFKTKWMSTLPRNADASRTYVLMTGHTGHKIDMATGPAVYQQPTRSLQYMKQGDSLKGVTGKFTFLLTNGWFADTASILKNQSTKKAEYPYGPDDNNDTDLNIVRLKALRSKTGVSGCVIELVISQTDGIQPTLTEFHAIKENDRFGISGNMVHYSLDLLPEVSINRNTVRQKIEENPLLRRAINITSELEQLMTYRQELARQGLMCTPKELYEDIKKLGYDWNMLLRTREYTTINQYDNPVPYLSSVDLLKIRKGLYFPYFLNEDKTPKDLYASALHYKDEVKSK